MRRHEHKGLLKPANDNIDPGTAGRLILAVSLLLGMITVVLVYHQI